MAVPLTFGPSRVHRLPRLSEHLGGKVELWAKREDLSDAGFDIGFRPSWEEALHDGASAAVPPTRSVPARPTTPRRPRLRGLGRRGGSAGGRLAIRVEPLAELSRPAADRILAAGASSHCPTEADFRNYHRQ